MRALYAEALPDGAIRCALCPHACRVPRGATGLCGVRANDGDGLVAQSYGRVTALALDPIEKKPLRRFAPGAHVLSIGSYGCNLRCDFCQNHAISMPTAARPGRPPGVPCRDMTPDELVDLAASMRGDGNIGLAYTYNEPLIGIEFVRDCAERIRARGMKNVVVTNGYVQPQPLSDLLDVVDAMNIDLKGFTDAYYRTLGGRLRPVQEAIALAASRCHVEVTTLIVGGENDEPERMDALAAWLASLDPGIPLHVSRFFPRFRRADAQATPVETVRRLCDVARGHLRHVYAGNA